MASDLFRNNYENHAIAYEASTGEKLPVLAEYLNFGELAQEILLHEADQTDAVAVRRTAWESDDLVMTFDLFERHNSIGKYYVMDVTELGVPGYKQYAFYLDSTIRYEHLDRDEYQDLPTPSTEHIGHQLAMYLRKKYFKTPQGEAALEWYDQRYSDILGQLTAENVLADPESLQYRVEAEANDFIVKGRAIESLYKIAIRIRENDDSMPISNLTSFRQGLSNALYNQHQHREARELSADTMPFPIITNPDLPQL